MERINQLQLPRCAVHNVIAVGDPLICRFCEPDIRFHSVIRRDVSRTEYLTNPQFFDAVFAFQKRLQQSRQRAWNN